MKDSSARVRKWRPLDNAAKIFPPTSNKRDTRVFRFACELTDPVDPDRLQKALDQTIERFPSFRVVLKRGLFWYYLEESDLRPEVIPETCPPCSTLYGEAKRLLFEVSYYGYRLNLEVYHALTDGTGALEFLRELTLRYLALVHPEIAADGLPALDYDASRSQRADDSFQRYSTAQKQLRLWVPKAYQIKGGKLPEYRFAVIEGVTSTRECLRIARSYGTTLAVFLSAVFMQAIAGEMSARARKDPVALTIPVNLRQHFESESARNFFSVFNVSYDFRENASLEAIIESVASQFKKGTSRESLQNTINVLTSLERNVLLRAVPLAIKDVAMNWGANFAERQSTASLSNVGRVVMPEAVRPYIRLFDVFTATDRMQLCFCSFEDNLTLSLTTAFESTDIPRRFFRTLTELGLSVVLHTTLEDHRSGEEEKHEVL